MVLPNRPQNPNNPIPNSPFYSPASYQLCGTPGPAIIGAGLCLNPNTGVLIATGGGGGGVTALAAGPGIALSATTGNITVCTNLVAGTNIALTPSGNQITVSATGLGTGTVTAITAGNGLNGGTITTSGSLSLNTNCVIPPNAFNIKGNLLVGTAAGAYTALNPGSDGQVLMACASAGGAGGPGMCWSPAGSVTSVSGTAPISVATGTTTPLITIAAASTTGSGAVQLNNTVSSTSTTQALTAAQGKVLQDQITSLVVNAGIELAGTIDASTGLVASVTSIGTSKGYATGAVLPAASSVTNSSYVIVTTPGTLTPPGGTATVATRGDWFLVSETSPSVYAWTFLNVGFDAPAATTTVPGIVELATGPETVTGTDATLAVTPAGAAAAYVAKSALTAKGDLISATAASTPSSLSVGTDGQVLVACAAATTGLCWTVPASSGISCACITAKGSLISGTAASTPTALPVGTDGNVLVACAAAATGLCWIAPTPSGIPCSCIVGKGGLVTGTAGSTPTGLSVGADGQVLAACSACTSGLTWVAQGAPPSATPGLGGTAQGVVWGCTTTGNTALGFNSINTLVTTGTANVSVGVNTFASVTTGRDNTLLGGQAGYAITTGSCNVGVGSNAGCAITTGGLNVAIGYNAAVASPTGSCQLAIGFSATDNWLIGDSSKNIQPGAGIKDCLGCLGTTGQVLSSTGAALQWVTGGLGDTPVGSVQFFAMSAAPAGWLVANGSAVSRTTYASLFAAVGTIYGAGNGSTTFNLPDLRGQFVRGWDAAGGTARGCDVSRIFGTSQTSSFIFDGVDVYYGNTGVQSGGENRITTGRPAQGHAYASSTPNTTAQGSQGIRPMNVALLPCIKYQVTTAPLTPSSGIPCSCITAKGGLITGSAADTPVALPVGTDGQSLIACSACSTGLTWATVASLDWVSAGTIQSVGLTSTGGIAPVPPAVVNRNNVSYRLVSGKTWQVAYMFSASTVFANVGNGDWLFTLPNSLQFNTTLVFQPLFTGSVNASNHANRQYFIPGPSSIQVAFSDGGNGSQFGAGVIVYSPTQFRIFTTDVGNGAPGPMRNNYWGNGLAGLSFSVGFQLTAV